MPRKKTYVLDTSVYLTNAECIYAFKTHDIHVPLKVFEEIDKHKKRQDAVGAQARKIIRIWDGLRSVGSLAKGVRIRKGLGIIKSISATFAPAGPSIRAYAYVRAWASSNLSAHRESSPKIYREISISKFRII